MTSIDVRYVPRADLICFPRTAPPPTLIEGIKLGRVLINKGIIAPLGRCLLYPRDEPPQRVRKVPKTDSTDDVCDAVFETFHD